MTEHVDLGNLVTHHGWDWFSPDGRHSIPNGKTVASEHDLPIGGLISRIDSSNTKVVSACFHIDGGNIGVLPSFERRTSEHHVFASAHAIRGPCRGSGLPGLEFKRGAGGRIDLIVCVCTHRDQHLSATLNRNGVDLGRQSHRWAVMVEFGRDVVVGSTSVAGQSG